GNLFRQTERRPQRKKWLPGTGGQPVFHQRRELPETTGRKGLTTNAKLRRRAVTTDDFGDAPNRPSDRISLNRKARRETQFHERPDCSATHRRSSIRQVANHRGVGGGGELIRHIGAGHRPERDPPAEWMGTGRCGVTQAREELQLVRTCSRGPPVIGPACTACPRRDPEPPPLGFHSHAGAHTEAGRVGGVEIAGGSERRSSLKERSHPAPRVSCTWPGPDTART